MATRYQTKTYTVSVNAGVTNAHDNTNFGPSLFNIYKIKITQDAGGTGGTFSFRIYKDSGFTERLVRFESQLSPFVSPVDRTAGAPGVEALEGRPFVYEDDSAGGNLHTEWDNNDSANHVYTIVVTYEEVVTMSLAGNVTARGSVSALTSMVLRGSSSGSLTLSVPAAAGSNTLTFPAGTTDFSATGGTSQVVKQTSAGGALTVAQLAYTDISGSLTPQVSHLGVGAAPDATHLVLISGGTVTADTHLLDMTETWNASGVTFTALKLNITNTASAAGSLLQDFQVGGVSKWAVDKNAKIVKYAGAAPTDGQILIGSTANGNFTAATLTAGANVTVTNASGGITIAATSGGVAVGDSPTWTGLHTWTPTQAANTVLDAIRLYDTTAATSGNQQYSTAIHFQGQGWKTNATAASQAVDFRTYVVPVQGTANPTGYRIWESAVNGGSYGGSMILSTGGSLGVGATYANLNLTGADGAVSISGATNGSAIEMITTNADAQQQAGQIGGWATANTGGKQVSYLQFDVVGTTATNRGGDIKFFTKADAGALRLAFTLDNAQNATIAGNLTVSGVGPHGIGIAPISAAQLDFGGSFSGTAIVNFENTLSPSAGASGFAIGCNFGAQNFTIQKAGSGTHAELGFLKVNLSFGVGAALVTDAFGISVTAFTAPASTTNASSLRFTAPTGATNNYGINGSFNSASNIAIVINDTNGGGAAKLASWRSSGTEVGSIVTSASTTTYNVTSDRRLKTNINDLSDALSVVLKIQVREFDYIADKTHSVGFIAQELQPCAPYAVYAPANEDEMWSVDYGRLTPLAIRAIQQLQSQIDEIKRGLPLVN